MKYLIKPIVTILVIFIGYLGIKNYGNGELQLDRTPEAEEKWEQIEAAEEDLAQKATDIISETGEIDWAKEFINGFENFTGQIEDFLEFRKSREKEYDSGTSTASENEPMAADVNENTSENVSEGYSLEQVTLVHISDGDTITVVAADGLEYRVRLIGIDTPESVNPDESKNNQYGQMASEHTKELLKDIDTLYLEYDEQTTDVYGRVLAYVWLTKDTSEISNMLNARILLDGYAADKVYMPNDRYAETFAELRKDAESESKGLWEYEEYRLLVKGEA